VAGALVSEFLMRPLSETLIEQRDQFILGLGRSRAKSVEEYRDRVRFGGHGSLEKTSEGMAGSGAIVRRL
jgi:hypothetical protein